MRRFVRAAAVLTFTAGAVLATGAGAQAADVGAQAVTVHGCRSGDVCIYPKASWNSDSPELRMSTYGAHNLVNHTGMHRVFNNQTGGAAVQLCKKYNGGDCGTKGFPGQFIDVDLTPINSIKLSE